MGLLLTIHTIIVTLKHLQGEFLEADWPLVWDDWWWWTNSPEAQWLTPSTCKETRGFSLTQEWWWRSRVFLLHGLFHLLLGEPNALFCHQDSWNRIKSNEIKTKQNSKVTQINLYMLENLKTSLLLHPQCLEMLLLKQKDQCCFRSRRKKNTQPTFFFFCCNVDLSRNMTC